MNTDLKTQLDKALSRPSLIHSFFKHCHNENAFLEEIDKTGGWPLGYKFVSFYHGVKDEGRVCIFTNQRLNTGWWTTVCSSDDYYWWKISEEKKAECAAKAKKELIRQLR